jgi:hypothetical protein
MTTSACDELIAEPERFVEYVFSDPRLKDKIFDDESFLIALKKAFKSDASLSEMVREIESKGESFDDCAKGVLGNSEIQRFIGKRRAKRRRLFRKRVKAQRPSITRKELTKEINRRIKISESLRKRNFRKLPARQVSIKESLQTVTVKRKVAGRIVVSKRQKSRPLSKAEEDLIKNNIKKSPSEIIRRHRANGFGYRSASSITSHYYRLKKKLKK